MGFLLSKIFKKKFKKLLESEKRLKTSIFCLLKFYLKIKKFLLTKKWGKTGVFLLTKIFSKKLTNTRI